MAQEDLRFLVVHSSQLAQQHMQTYASAQEKEAEVLTDHVQRVHARWFACEADAAAAIAEYEHQEPGRRGRRPHPAVSCGTLSCRCRHPARDVLGGGVPPRATRPRWRWLSPSRRRGGARQQTRPMDGWCWLTVHAEVCSDTDILQAYQDQNTTVEPGFRWIKNPAAIAPVQVEA